jgi:D-glycero-D-manno-heptose 1,7-bisphosphate phosphatase
LPDRPRRAVFLDRDGVINRKAAEGDYVKSWTEFEFLPTALEALAVLARQPVRVVIVTNQRGIALGNMTKEDLDDIHSRMLAAVSDAGGRIDAVYYCPHDGGCQCRKPAPGMLTEAARDLGLDLRRSALVGDRMEDMAAAATVGALKVLVGDPKPGRLDVDHSAHDVLAAARWLLTSGFNAP